MPISPKRTLWNSKQQGAIFDRRVYVTIKTILYSKKFTLYVLLLDPEVCDDTGITYEHLQVSMLIDYCVKM